MAWGKIARLPIANLRDLPSSAWRLVAWQLGWDAAAFPGHVGGFFHLYVLAR